MISTEMIAITGASSGIGAATAEKFASEGYGLILIARDLNKLHTVSHNIKAKYPDISTVVYSVDLTSEKSLREMYESLKKFHIKCWINNAGFGDYKLISDQDIEKANAMISLNVTAMTLLSMLYVKDYENVSGSQLINVSSAGGYLMVPTCVTYCATKFFVSAFTENLALELKHKQSALKAKVFAPAATQTNFGKVANDVTEYDYDHAFGESYFTSEQSADFLLQLFHSDDHFVGGINRQSFEFELSDNHFDFAGSSDRNQSL
ncbi:SDR family NAD(P)-dependent oxidoreductase [Agrilactobacillus yilanensis]|uniref:SDR family NAD(P)-dependent oxidoreductase n=1 Tax=Agrilactobacillus yilanensis TaxID=2485997 RepID=A0ABW4J5U1_9LACO|nr:SDR family NAD(P)-dependent oxidoreductase [Agrilactobacillus yilanensis]